MRGGEAAVVQLPAVRRQERREHLIELPRRRYGNAQVRSRLHGETQVLAVQANPEARRVFALHQVRPAQLQHAGLRKAAGQGGDHLLGVHARFRAQHQRLAHRGDVQAHHDLIRDLHVPAVAHVIAHVDDGLAHGLEDGQSVFEIRRSTTHHDGERALPGAYVAPAHGGIEHAHAPLPQGLSHLPGDAGSDGAHVDEKRTFPRAFDDTPLTQGNQLDVRRIGQTGDDDVGLGSRFRCGHAHHRARLSKFFERWLAPVVGGHRMACFQQVQHHGLAHDAGSDKSDGSAHCLSLLLCDLWSKQDARRSLWRNRESLIVLALFTFWQITRRVGTPATSPVRSSLASSPLGPTSCTPSGIPSAPSSRGSVTAGVPHKVQMVQKTGFPVAPSPSGACPGAGGVRMASNRSNISPSKPFRTGTFSTAPGCNPTARYFLPRSIILRRRSLSWSLPRSLFRLEVPRKVRFQDDLVPLDSVVERLWKFDFLHNLPAQTYRQLLKRCLRVLIGLIPDRRFHERESRSHRRLRGGGFQQSRGPRDAACPGRARQRPSADRPGRRPSSTERAKRPTWSIGLDCGSMP